MFDNVHSAEARMCFVADQAHPEVPASPHSSTASSQPAPHAASSLNLLMIEVTKQQRRHDELWRSGLRTKAGPDSTNSIPAAPMTKTRSLWSILIA